MDVWPKTERRHSLLQAQPAHCDKPASAYITAVSQTFQLQFGACRVHTDARCKHKVRRSTRYSPGHAEERLGWCLAIQVRLWSSTPLPHVPGPQAPASPAGSTRKHPSHYTTTCAGPRNWLPDCCLCCADCHRRSGHHLSWRDTQTYLTLECQPRQYRVSTRRRTL
jgi:hypothetical protein